MDEMISDLMGVSYIYIHIYVCIIILFSRKRETLGSTVLFFFLHFILYWIKNNCREKFNMKNKTKYAKQRKHAFTSLLKKFYSSFFMQDAS